MLKNSLLAFIVLLLRDCKPLKDIFKKAQSYSVVGQLLVKDNLETGLFYSICSCDMIESKLLRY